MRSIIYFAFFALAAALIVPRYAAQMHAGAAVSRPAAARPAPAAEAANFNAREVVIPPGRNGHFEVEGHVNGVRMDFMVDTGASVIALNARDAAMLGIHPAEHDYSAMVRTANGTVRAAPVTLDRVEVADLVVHDVAAMVMPDGALAGNLLGLSFLQRLHRFEYADGRLVLEQ